MRCRRLPARRAINDALAEASRQTIDVALQAWLKGKNICAKLAANNTPRTGRLAAAGLYVVAHRRLDAIKIGRLAQAPQPTSV